MLCATLQAGHRERPPQQRATRVQPRQLQQSRRRGCERQRPAKLRYHCQSYQSLRCARDWLPRSLLQLRAAVSRCCRPQQQRNQQQQRQLRPVRQSHQGQSMRRHPAKLKAQRAASQAAKSPRKESCRCRCRPRSHQRQQRRRRACHSNRTSEIRSATHAYSMVRQSRAARTWQQPRLPSPHAPCPFSAREDTDIRTQIESAASNHRTAQSKTRGTEHPMLAIAPACSRPRACRAPAAPRESRRGCAAGVPFAAPGITGQGSGRTESGARWFGSAALTVILDMGNAPINSLSKQVLKNWAESCALQSHHPKQSEQASGHQTAVQVIEFGPEMEGLEERQQLFEIGRLENLPLVELAATAGTHAAVSSWSQCSSD